MKLTEAKFLPFTKDGKKWWVYEIEINDEDFPILEILEEQESEAYRPTGKIVGKYETITEAKKAHPDLRLSRQAKQAIEKGEY